MVPVTSTDVLSNVYKSYEYILVVVTCSNPVIVGASVTFINVNPSLPLSDPSSSSNIPNSLNLSIDKPVVGSIKLPNCDKLFTSSILLLKSSNALTPTKSGSIPPSGKFHGLNPPFNATNSIPSSGVTMFNTLTLGLTP